MRIVQIVPGSGGSFYCQNCLRDNALVQELRRQGHDVVLVPMYLPMLADGGGPDTESPVFYGAVSLYLRQRFPVLRRLPALLSRLLDAPPLLRLAAGMSGSTRASGLEEMTLSMLRGEQGDQAAELERLVAWLASGERPDIVHLSNALLLGLARRIKQQIGVPIVCSLQDEDVWIDAMDEPHAGRTWQLMAERAGDVDLFLPVSRTYGARMQERLQLQPDRLQVVHPGIEINGLHIAPVTQGPPVIGYLSRLCESLGLELLVEAFLLLRQEPPLRELQLRLTGGATGDDRRFLRRLQRRLNDQGAAAAVTLQPSFSAEERSQLLSSLTVLSVPVPAGEAFGTYLLEAMAAGVPVVQPAAGAFPEIVELTGGGVVYSGDRPADLAAALRPLLLDRQRAAELGARGRRSVLGVHTIQRMAERTLAAYETIARSPALGTAAPTRLVAMPGAAG